MSIPQWAGSAATANMIATVALVATLAVWWFGTRTDRPRTTVVATSKSSTHGSYVVVTVRHMGRPVTVEEVTFETADPGNAPTPAPVMSLPQGIAAVRELLTAAGSELAATVFEPLPPGAGGRTHRLEHGESVSWACSVGAPSASTEPQVGRYRAVVRLSHGRPVRSPAFVHHQTPPW